MRGPQLVNTTMFLLDEILVLKFLETN